MSNIILSVVSIILSGLFSLGASFLYFKKANRNAALANVVEEIQRTIDDYPTKKMLKKIGATKDKYEFRYLKEAERDVILNLYSALHKSTKYSEMETDCKILNNHFFKILKGKGIKINVYPYEDYSSDHTFYLPPPAFDHMEEIIRDKLKSNIDLYELPLADNFLYLQNDFNRLFNHYVKTELKQKEQIDFFESESFDSILNNDRLKQEYKKRWEEYDSAKEAFEEEFESHFKNKEEKYNLL